LAKKIRQSAKDSSATAVLYNIAIENNEDPPLIKQREEALFNQAVDVPIDLIANANDGK
jgi:hypothetical protein